MRDRWEYSHIARAATGIAQFPLIGSCGWSSSDSPYFLHTGLLAFFGSLQSTFAGAVGVSLS